jgi:hypothetical protein
MPPPLLIPAMITFTTSRSDYDLLSLTCPLTMYSGWTKRLPLQGKRPVRNSNNIFTPNPNTDIRIRLLFYNFE